MCPMHVALHEVTWYGAWLYGENRTHWDGSSFKWYQPCKNQTMLRLHHLGGYPKYTVESYFTHLEAHDMWQECSESAQEQRSALYKSHQQQQHNKIRIAKVKVSWRKRFFFKEGPMYMFANGTESVRLQHPSYKSTSPAMVGYVTGLRKLLPNTDLLTAFHWCLNGSWVSL